MKWSRKKSMADEKILEETRVRKTNEDYKWWKKRMKE